MKKLYKSLRLLNGENKLFLKMKLLTNEQQKSYENANIC